MDYKASAIPDENSYKKITSITVGSVIGAIGSGFVATLIGVFASDSGTNIFSDISLALAIGIPAVTLVCIVLSYVKKSVKIARVGSGIALIPLVIFLLILAFGGAIGGMMTK